MDISKLNQGDAVELLVDANAIPAGCYQFLEIHGEMSVFTVGDDIIIGLATDFWSKFMRPAEESGALLSSEREFATRYSELYAQLRNKSVPTNPSRLTFCMLNPQVLARCGADVDLRVASACVSEPLH
jgi:hypothetical protein